VRAFRLTLSSILKVTSCTSLPVRSVSVMANSNDAPSRTSEAALPASPDSPIPHKRKKLTGRAFYERLGSPKMVLAPMVDQSEFVRCFLSVAN